MGRCFKFKHQFVLKAQREGEEGGWGEEKRKKELHSMTKLPLRVM